MKKLFVVVLVLLSGCVPSYWNTQSPPPSQTINLYNPDGSRAGYGTVQGGEAR